MEENSISIINRTNGQLTGEKAQALPIKVIGQWSWIRFVLIGALLAVVVMLVIFFGAKKTVVSVDVSGKSDQFQVFQIQ